MTGNGSRTRDDVRSPIAAAALSALIPGVGQWYAGHPGRGAVFAIPFAVGVILAGAGAAMGVFETSAVLSWAVQPTILRIAFLSNLGILIWRIAAVIDAYVIAQGTRRVPRWSIPAIAVIVVVVGAPQVVAGAYTARGIALLEDVFVVVDDPVDAAVATGASPAPLAPDPRLIRGDADGGATTRSARNLVFRRDLGDPEARAAWGDIIAPPSPDAPFVPYGERIGADRVTILLVGADEGPGREGLRTDTMIVATVDVDSGDAALFGLPRNMKRVPLPGRFQGSFIELQKRVNAEEGVDRDGDGYPDHWIDEDDDEIPDEPEFVPCGCFPEMLNRVHQYTRNWSRTYPTAPDPGLAALRDVIALLVDLPIDYYFMVNMAGFVDVVDALGGIDVMVSTPFHVAVSAPSDESPKARIDVEPGMNHLDGLEALAYARWRIGSSDYSRMQRQRCLIRAAVDQVDPFSLLRSFPTLADVVERSVVTDIPLNLLPDLIGILGRVELDRITTVGLVPPTYNTGRAPGGYPIPNVGRIRSKVAEVIAGIAEPTQVGAGECGM